MIAKYLKPLCFLALLAGAGLCFAQEEVVEEEDLQQETSPLDEFRWQTSGEGSLGLQGTIDIPEGYRFLDGTEAATLMQLLGNLPREYAGMIAPDDYSWLVTFQFSPEGYVDDSEKEDLDPDELLAAMQEAQFDANQERRRRGLTTLTLTGWASEPSYNTHTNNLEWGMKLVDADSGTEGINYLTKILGRRGYMDVVLLCEPEQLEGALPDYQKLLTGFEYTRGNSYAEYQDGDKLAEYGLKGLIAGGAFYGAAKLGLFALLKKGFKFIVAGVVAIGLFLKRLITGKSADADA